MSILYKSLFIIILFLSITTLYSKNPKATSTNQRKTGYKQRLKLQQNSLVKNIEFRLTKSTKAEEVRNLMGYVSDITRLSGDEAISQMQTIEKGGIKEYSKITAANTTRMASMLQEMVTDGKEKILFTKTKKNINTNKD